MFIQFFVRLSRVFFCIHLCYLYPIVYMLLSDCNTSHLSWYTYDYMSVLLIVSYRVIRIVYMSVLLIVSYRVIRILFFQSSIVVYLRFFLFLFLYYYRVVTLLTYRGILTFFFDVDRELSWYTYVNYYRFVTLGIL